MVNAGPDLHQVVRGGGSHSGVSCESMNMSSTSQPNSPKTASHTHSINSQATTVSATAPVGGGKNGGGVGGSSSNGQRSGGNSDLGNSSPTQQEPGNRRKRSRMQYYDLNCCLECEVKDAEIKTLRRRIQVMEEVVALLNQKMNAIQQSSNSMLFSPMVMPPVVSQVVIPTTFATSTPSIKVQ